MARSIEKVIEDTIIEMGTLYDSTFDYEFEEALRDEERFLDDDEGEFNWQRDHKEIKGTIYCGVGIFHGSIEQIGQGVNPWVWKWDAGSESYTEKEKGEASDSFKRACFNWGIGRELYTAPLIFIRAKTEPQGNGYKLANKSDGYGYKVAQIEYKDGRIAKLIITKDGEQKFYYEADKFMEQSQNTIDDKMAQMVLTLAEDAKNKEVLNSMGIRTPADVKRMTIAQYGDFARRCNQ